MSSVNIPAGTTVTVDTTGASLDITNTGQYDTFIWPSGQRLRPGQYTHIVGSPSNTVTATSPAGSSITVTATTDYIQAAHVIDCGNAA